MQKYDWGSLEVWALPGGAQHPDQTGQLGQVPEHKVGPGGAEDLLRPAARGKRKRCRPPLSMAMQR